MDIGVNFLKNFFKEKKNIYILFAIGILLLVISNIFTSDKETEISQKTSYEFDISNEERRLKEILSKIRGAGKTEVMITYDTGVEKVTVQNSKINKSEKNDSKNKEGEDISTEYSEENEIVTSGSGSSQTPFIAKEIQPRVRGVLVVSDGAENETVRINITNAVAAVMDVPYYRIQVLPKSN